MLERADGAGSAAALAADANVTGEWDMTVETQAGTGTPHFSLKQDGTRSPAPTRVRSARRRSPAR